MLLFTLIGGIIFLGEKLTVMGTDGLVIAISGMMITNAKKNIIGRTEKIKDESHG